MKKSPVNQGKALVPAQSNSNSKVRRKRRQNTSQVPVPTRKTVLSSCADEYLRVLLDPFNTNANLKPCIPDLLDIPSFKVCTRIRGTFSIGTAGVGFIAVSPYNFDSTTACAYFTSSAFTGNAFAITGTGVNPATDPQVPWSGASAVRPGRLVACGVRIRYAGTELNRGGSIVPLAANNSIALGAFDRLNDMTFNSALSRPNVKTYPVTSKWVGCTLLPQHMNDYEYGPYQITDQLRLGVLVSAPLVAQTYEYEIVRYFEFLPVRNASGALTVPDQTPSHSDVTGMSYIRDFLGTVASSDIGQSVYNTAIEYIKSSMRASMVPLLTSV